MSLLVRNKCWLAILACWKAWWRLVYTICDKGGQAAWSIVFDTFTILWSILFIGVSAIMLVIVLAFTIVAAPLALLEHLLRKWGVIE